MRWPRAKLFPSRDVLQKDQVSERKTPNGNDKPAGGRPDFDRFGPGVVRAGIRLEPVTGPGV